jgi:RNA polymerase sigma-70 factor (ECF subfamily)
VNPSAQFADDVRQTLREELLVGSEGRPPKIADYTGRGPLGGWVRVVAVRRALNLRRGGQRASAHEGEELPFEVASNAPDPELDYLKALYRTEFREAFVGALARLGRPERNALRFHHLDGLTLEETAILSRVSRATVARWLAEAREQILRDTLRLLRERLGLDEASMKSVLRLVQSQLDVSIHRYLAEGDAAADEADEAGRR